MTSEGEVLAAVLIFRVSVILGKNEPMRNMLFFLTTHCIATRPSTLPIAYPLPAGDRAGKQVITRVCIFRGDSFD